MIMRERLIKLIQSVPVDYDGYVGVDRVVDHLIANGVIVPCCTAVSYATYLRAQRPRAPSR